MKESHCNQPQFSSGKITLGISTCLLGEQVRYDGGHKLDRYLRDTLGQYIEWVPVCPEVEVGMTIPREAVRLVGDPDQPRLIGNRSGQDWTDAMTKYAQQRCRALEANQLCGFIFKSRSPSSGMERVKVYSEKGMVIGHSPGLFAKQFMQHFPQLPTEEEGRLHDVHLRENFIERIFAFHRLQQFWRQPHKRGDVIRFHSEQKLLLMAHSPKHYQELGQLVAHIKDYNKTLFQARYTTLFLQALTRRATVKKNTNVLLHMLGYLKKQLDSQDKQYILRVIDDYHHQQVPLIVPLTLLKHYIEKFNIDYLCQQSYLHPHPKELMLRNHV